MILHNGKNRVLAYGQVGLSVVGTALLTKTKSVQKAALTGGVPCAYLNRL
ncbi:MAG: hypothetical protein WC124_09420 [Desulfoplanes sp.]